MKKIFKSLTIAIIAITAALACIFVVGCNDGDKDGKSDYNFTVVYEDGTAVNGQTDGDGTLYVDGKPSKNVAIQVCIIVNNKPGSCIPINKNYSLNSKGKLSLSQEQVNSIFVNAAVAEEGAVVTQFVFHVMNVADHNSDCEVTVNGVGDYTVTVTAA